MKIQAHEKINSLVLISVLVLLTSRVGSIRFDLESGHFKCISQDMAISSMTVGNYHIVKPNEEQHPLPDSHKISVRVTSAHGVSNHYSENVSEGHFSFQSAESGDYTACFFAADHKPSTTITVDFDWNSGVAAKDWTNVAKKGSIESMEVELKKMVDTVHSIHHEMMYLSSREFEMRKLNRSTNSKMAWLGFLSLAISLSVTGLQFVHLKSFFQKKKII